MGKILKYLEKIIEVLTIITSIWTAIEVIRTYAYQKKLKQKADIYLDDELELEGNIRGSVCVFSPTLKGKKQKLIKLIAAVSIGTIVSIILHLFSKGYDRD